MQPGPGLKTGMDFRGLVLKRVSKITFFGLKLGHDLRKREAHPHQEFPEVTPQGKKSLLFLFHPFFFLFRNN